jgi:hypothetical protein
MSRPPAPARERIARDPSLPLFPAVIEDDVPDVVDSSPTFRRHAA